MIVFPTSGAAAKSIASLGAFAALLQVAGVPPIDAGWIDQIGKLGTNVLLAVAVIVLWRKLQEKDVLLMANYKSMADSLAANASVVEKMSETLEAIKETVERLETVRQQIGRGT